MSEFDMEVICSCGSDDMREYVSGNLKYRMCRNCWKEEDDCDTHKPARPKLTRMENVDIPDSKTCGLIQQDTLLDDIGSDKVMSLSTHEEPVKWKLKHITKDDVDDSVRLLPGDHVMWRRPYVVCHHAIVMEQSDNDFKSEKLKVIHWAPTEDSRNHLSIEIRAKTIELRKERGSLYRIRYEKRIEDKNSTDLVKKRAEALLGLKDYNFFRRNCENFARFCKTGVHFNLQYPWLKRKLDQTMTSTLVKSMTALLFADFVRVDWGLKFHILGTVVILILEFVSLVTDLANAYFQYKYPTSYLRPLRDFQEAIVMRIFEFIFGSAGMIVGVIALERLCIYIGDSYCPGMGTWVGYALGTLVFGIIGGFALGVAGKALGNAIGIRISEKFSCCTTSEQSTDDQSVSIDAESRMKKRKMVRRYLARSWIAQGGMILIIFGFILLLAYAKQYFKIYHDFTFAKKTKCTTKEVTFLSEDYPCPVVYIELYNQSGSSIPPANQSEGSSSYRHQHKTQIFENERVFHQRSCSYQPRCRENDTKTAIEMNKYLRRFGSPGTTFSCYFLPKDPSMVTRKRESLKIFTVVFIVSSLLICVGVGLIAFSAYKVRSQWRTAIVKNRKKSIYRGQIYTEKLDSWPITLISVLGLTSYLYALRWFKNFYIVDI